MQGPEHRDLLPPALHPAAALLHLQCELAAELRPALVRWWEEFHFAELLSLQGFRWARRARLIGPQGASPIVTMYGLTDPAAADQPRPPEFTVLPGELDGKVTFNRRILRRVTPAPPADEPVSASFLQLLRPPSGGDTLTQAVERIRRWPHMLSVSAWRTVSNDPHTRRQEVVHLGNCELIHAELTAGDAQIPGLLDRAGNEFPDRDSAAYASAASRTTSPS